MTRRQNPSPSAAPEHPVPVAANVPLGPSTVAQQAHGVPRPVDHQTLKRLQLELPQQQMQEAQFRDSLKERARRVEEKVASLRKDPAPLGGMNLPTPQLDCHPKSDLQADQSWNQTDSDSSDPRDGLDTLAATKVCEACRTRQTRCTSTGDQMACIPCAASNRVCSYTGAPPSERDTQPITRRCFASLSSKVQTHIVPAAHGHAFSVRAGSRFRIVDLHGAQVVDFMAWCAPYKTSVEHLSMSYTRHAIGGSAPPQVGECLYTNRDEPIFRLTADTVKTHDMLYMACNPGFYKRLGQEGHRSCATNIAEAMRGFGMESWLEVTDPFNVFQNTPYYSLKALNCSRAGDYVELEVLKDAVCAVSSCPFDGDGFNGGKVTEVAVVTGI